MKKVIVLALLVVVILFACSKNKDLANVDCSTAKSFTTDVSPVFQSSCSYNSGCHGTGSTKGPGALVSYNQIYNNRVAIRASVMNGSMPENGSLSSSALSAIVCWIDAGATNN
ncbi:MAG: hypothetical protein NTW29_20095 [Bacteroidetes bacterium]|nr:hypothetical protein [Bacteroidota bacterium]